MAETGIVVFPGKSAFEEKRREKKYRRSGNVTKKLIFSRVSCEADAVRSAGYNLYYR